MLRYFKNILIPVDLSINTEVAIKKAIDLADEGTYLHLLHVQSYGLTAMAQRFLIKSNAVGNREIITQKIDQWKTSIEECTEGITVHTWISIRDSVQKAIEEKAREIDADLVVIAKNSHHSWLPFLNTVLPNRLATTTGAAVLTVKTGAIYSKIKTVIVPITNRTAKHKMEAISVICKKFRVKIYLVTFMNEEPEVDDHNASALLQVYQWLKTSIHCPVEYAVLQGHNKAKAILAYAEKINADILLVHPETETKIGWLNKQISDVLPPASKMQVLAIQPANTLTT